MRRYLWLSLSAAVCAVALAPSASEAGPFGRRGGSLNRLVSPWIGGAWNNGNYGYSNYGYSNLGYSNLGYSNYGYSNYGYSQSYYPQTYYQDSGAIYGSGVSVSGYRPVIQAGHAPTYSYPSTSYYSPRSYNSYPSGYYNTRNSYRPAQRWRGR